MPTEIIYNTEQFMFFLDIILIIIFIVIGESTKKDQYFKRGMAFFTGGILLLFTGVDTFFTQSYWWMSAAITFAGGMYLFRAFLNLSEVKRAKSRSELTD